MNLLLLAGILFVAGKDTPGKTQIRVIKPMNLSALVFMHVFKAGGTSYGAALAKYARAHKIPFFTDMRQGKQMVLPSAILEMNKKAKHLAEAPSGRGFTIFHGHLCDLGLAKLNSLHGGVLGPFLRAPLFVAVLREPSARLVSVFLQLTAGLRHERGAALSMDPKTLQGGRMDKDRLEDMFAQFMRQQEVAQCRIVPNQVLGAAWASPCASVHALDSARLVSMSQLLERSVLPLLTERTLDSAALLDHFLAGAGYKHAPSVRQFMLRNPFRCGKYQDWRQGRRHGALEECRDAEGYHVDQGARLLSDAIRHVVSEYMGYEMWLYSNATSLFKRYLEVYSIDSSTEPCNISTSEGCSKKQRAYLDIWKKKSLSEIQAELGRQNDLRRLSSAKEIQALRKVPVLEALQKKLREEL